MTEETKKAIARTLAAQISTLHDIARTLQPDGTDSTDFERRSVSMAAAFISMARVCLTADRDDRDDFLQSDLEHYAAAFGWEFLGDR